MTENKNTLFRFVTLRGPQLLEDQDKTGNFIFHFDPEEEGYFTDQISNAVTDPTLQRSLLKALAADFVPFPSLQGMLGTELYDFSKWLAKNAVEVSKNPIPIQTMELDTVYDWQLVALWDNLFYQLITGQDPSLQEQIIQALVAINFRRSYGQPGQNKKAIAKVVIPRSFFSKVPDATIGKPISVVNPSEVTSSVINDLNGAIKTVASKDRITRLQKTAAELNNAKQSWEKANNDAYETAKKIHDTLVDGILREAATITDELSGRTKFTEPLDLPSFEFVPLPELDTATVNPFLSDESKNIAAELSLFSLSGFLAADVRLKQAIQEETAVVFDQANLTTQVAAVNNVLLPVAGRVPTGLLPYAYTIQAILIAPQRYRILLALDCGYNNPAANDLLYTAHYGSTNNTNGGFVPQVSGSRLVLELFPGGLTLPSGTTAFTLDGRISLSSGVALEFDAEVNIITGGLGVMNPVTSDPEITSAPGFLDVYIPSGFGMKRLGIADYRKVEQSTCCYVPGDVSHIENVMAREYKEKSTRRLRRSEETTTTETEMEKEQLTDTTTATRQDMQQEVASVLAKDSSATSSTSLSGSYGPVTMGLSAGFSQNSSQQQSNSQAVSYAKDVTERALDRVLQKVREERVVKIVEEYEEQNKHGFDNRRGDKHVSGVYRWVDKIYKNKVLNYGKRLMYEFMLPQPAVFHMEAMKTMPGAPATVVLNKPIDPRSADAGVNKMSTFSDINEFNYKYWAAVYGAEVDGCPEKTKTIGKSFSGNKNGGDEMFDGATDLQIPENYIARSANIKLLARTDGDRSQPHSLIITVGNINYGTFDNRDVNKTDTLYQPLDDYREQLPISYACRNYPNFTIGITVRLEATIELINKWKLETFDTVIKAYETKRKEYEDAVIAGKQESKTANPGFYRLIENSVLRKNCISYLVGHNNLGRELYSGDGVTGKKISDTANLDRYSSLVKFIEQAFEWNEISYTFYPYYWADKSKWQELYQQEVDDALFRSFLQSGMARVVASVRPGFEEAVLFYMATGQVWSGGQVPVIGDDLFLSIVDELKNPEYTIEETWETRVPTTLTMIQKGATGLNTEGLPCDCGDPQNGFFQSDDLMGVTPDDGEPLPELPPNPPDEDGINPPDSPSEPEEGGDE